MTDLGQSQENNRDNGLRNYEEISGRKPRTRGHREPAELDIGKAEQAGSDNYLTGPVTQAQVRIIKDEI